MVHRGIMESPMSESTYEVLARILRDNVAEAARCTADQLSYKDGIDASSARIQAAMWGLPKPGQPEWRGKPPDPVDTAPKGKIIDADYTTGFGDHSEWTMPKEIPSV